MTGRIGRSAEGNGLGNDKGKRPHVRKRMVSLLLAAVMVFSAVFIVINAADDSEAAMVNVSSGEELVAAAAAANDGDVINITSANIELKTTLIINRNITLTSSCNTTITPASDFVKNEQAFSVRLINSGANPHHYEITKISDLGDMMIYATSRMIVYSDTLVANSNAPLSTFSTYDPGSDSWSLGQTPSDTYTVTLNGGWYVDGEGKEHGYRIVYQDRGKMIINSGTITNGYHHRNGAGLFITNGAGLIMNGGSVIGNHLDQNAKNKAGVKYIDTVCRFSADVWSSAGTKAVINGGEIGLIFQNVNSGTYSGETTLNNGTIGTIYVCSNGPNQRQGTFTYNGGTVGNVYLSTFGNSGASEETFTYSEVKSPTPGKQYKAGTHVAMVNGIGYSSLDEAYKVVPDGGTVEIISNIITTAPFTQTNNVNITIAEDHNKTGYYLEGYYTEPYGTTKVLKGNGQFVKPDITGFVTGGKWSVSENKTLYAQWWTTIGIFDGGTNISDVNVIYGCTSIYVGDVAKYGYNLQGFFTEVEGGTKVLNADGSFVSENVPGYITNGKWTKTGTSIVLYAQYEPKTFTVKLDKGTDGDRDGSITVTYDSDVLTDRKDAVRTGHRITGYFTEAEGGTMVITADGKLVSGNVLSIVTGGKWTKAGGEVLYAQWTIGVYQVGLRGNGVNDIDISITYGDTGISISSIPWRTGYTLLGFFTDEVGGTKVLDAHGVFAGQDVPGYISGGKWIRDGDCELYAQWSANSYDIHLHHGTKGFSHGKAVVMFDGLSVLIHEVPVKIGHKLIGFFTHESEGTMVLNADGTFAAHNVDDHITDGKWSKDAHHTLYAQWAPNEAPSENGYILEIVAGCALEALIVIGIASVIRRR